MSKRTRRKAVVPEAREALNQFKSNLLANEGVIAQGTPPQEVATEVAKEVGVPLKKGYNGNISTKDAGKVGGQIGGRMVKELIRMAQEQLVNQKNR